MAAETDTAAQPCWEDSWKALFSSPETKSILEVGFRTRSASIDRTATPELRRIAKTGGGASEEDLRDELSKVTVEQLRGLVAQESRDLGREFAAWEKKRRVGWRKVTTGTLELADSFDAFLVGFSGVLEVIQLADSQYAGAAVFVLTLFYATVKLKSSNDDSIQESMRNIGLQLPDLDIYRQIFADVHLANMLAHAYSDILEFIREATAYFAGHGTSRFFAGIASPGKFKGIKEGMIQNFKEIRVRCNALVAQRIDNLSTQNDKLISQVRVLQSEVQALHQRKDSEAVQAMRALLGQQSLDNKQDRERRLPEYRQLLAGVFRAHSYDSAEMTLARLQETSEYQSWCNETASSSMLVLHGCNDRAARLIQQSWLTIPVLDHIRDAQRVMPHATLAYCLCTPDMTAENVMRNLIQQLLEQQPQVLRSSSVYEDMQFHLGPPSPPTTPSPGSSSNNRSEAQLSPSSSSSSSPSSSLERCCRAFQQMIQGCECPVHIVINRPEVCRGDDTWPFIKSLLHVIESIEGAKLKVLVVVRTENWNIEDRVCDVEKGIIDSRKLLVLRRDQTMVCE